MKSKEEAKSKNLAPSAPAENKTLAQTKADDDIFGFLPRAESTDFDIPRLTLIQPTSKIEGSEGDVIDSSTGQKVAGLNQKLVFAPVWFFKDFTVTETDSKKFRRNEPKTPDNAHFSVFDNRISTDPDGVSVERKERLSVFVVQKSSLQDDLPRLYRMILKASSFKEAKKLLSEWDIQVRSKLVPFQFLWSVSPKKIVNEKGKYFIYEFQKEMAEGKQQRVSAEELEKIRFWVKTLSQNQEKIVAAPDEEEMRTVKQSDDVIPF